MWRLYAGWYDGDPSHLRPPRAASLGQEVASLAGGVQALTSHVETMIGRSEAALAAHQSSTAATTAAATAQERLAAKARLQDRVSVAATLIEFAARAIGHTTKQYGKVALGGTGSTTGAGGAGGGAGAQASGTGSDRTPTHVRNGDAAVVAQVHRVRARVYKLQGSMETSLMGQSIARAARIESTEKVEEVERSSSSGGTIRSKL